MQNEKAHARIIWDACWAEDDGFFVTASRDKTVRLVLFFFAPHATDVSYALFPPDSSSFFQAKVWVNTSSDLESAAGKWACPATLKFDEAATAVAATTLSSPPCAVLLLPPHINR